MSLLELLQRGDVDAFNLARSQRDRPDLFAADLAEASLSGVDLSAAVLSKADLTGADLSDATLLRADLSGADGTGANLAGALAIRCRLREAYFDEACLDGADLSQADLTEAVLAGGSGEGVRLVGATLRRTDCKGVRWRHATLHEVKGHQCDLTGADLADADLTDAVLTEAKLAGATLTGVTAVRTNFGEADLSGAKLAGASLPEANLRGANLRGADLRGVDLSRANLGDAAFEGADLSGANLAGAYVTPGGLAGAKLEGADLSGHDPRLLGIGDEVVATLARHGADEVVDAPLLVAEPSAARRGDTVAILWMNPDSDTRSTLRWGLVGPAGVVAGAVALPAEGVVAKAVVPTPTGFVLVVVLERPGGHQLVRVPLRDDGTVLASTSHELGYPPAVVPVVTWTSDGARLTGLARRGPTVVIQELRDDGPVPVGSAAVPTATGFWSVHSPVIATRGGVVIAVDGDKPGDPVRTPAGFPGRIARVVRSDGDLVAVWYEASDEPGEPGWLRSAVLGGRGEPVVRTVHRPHRLKALDVVAGPGGLRIAWVEAQDLLVAFAWTAVVPRGAPAVVEAAGDAVTDVRWAPGLPGEAPALVVTTLDRGAVILDGKRTLGEIGEGSA